MARRKLSSSGRLPPWGSSLERLPVLGQGYHRFVVPQIAAPIRPSRADWLTCLRSEQRTLGINVTPSPFCVRQRQLWEKLSGPFAGQGCREIREFNKVFLPSWRACCLRWREDKGGMVCDANKATKQPCVIESRPVLLG